MYTIVTAVLQGHLLSVKGHMLASLDAAVASEQDAGASRLAAKQVRGLSALQLSSMAALVVELAVDECLQRA